MFGPGGSFSSLHIEGGVFCSINLITNENGEKFWLCLDVASAKLFMELVDRLKLQTNKCPYARNGRKCGNGRPCVEVCACEKSAFHGPGYFVTPEFLRKHNIPYFTFIQHPGDLVFTFPGVAHQIVNTRSTVCEARNIMPLTFSFNRESDLVCDCDPEYGGRVFYPLDLQVMPKIPYDAFCEDCQKVFFFQTPEEHKKVCCEGQNIATIAASDVAMQSDMLVESKNDSKGVSVSNTCSFSPEPEMLVVVPDISVFSDFNSEAVI